MEKMREILFRGKRLDGDEWVYGWYEMYPFERFPVRPCIIPSESAKGGYYEHVEVDHATVGQYTGLTDKNGVKIFEGDIVRYGDTTHRVVFEQRNGTAYFGLVYGPQETLPFGHYQDLRQIAIIGNIHDNPELLNET